MSVYRVWMLACFVSLCCGMSAVVFAQNNAASLTDLQLAQQLGQQLKSCNAQIELYEERVELLEAHKKSCQQANDSGSQCFVQVDQLREQIHAFIETKNEIITEQRSIIDLRKDTLDTCMTTLNTVKAGYDELYKDYRKPWYQNLLFWLGLTLGLAIGVPI